jgi:MYXO-CTERM domain-containing protein
MRAAVLSVVFVAVLLPSKLAWADAVPPPPEDCPKGQVGVTSHRGPACVLEAPKDCAPGYRGNVGGTCSLAACSSDQECEGGTRCFQVDTCQEHRELHWDGWGWSARRPVAVSGNFMAGPARPAPEGPPPSAWIKLRICGQDGPCNAPAECRPAGLCYPPNAVGKTKAKVVAAAPVAEALPEGVYPQTLIAPDQGRNVEKTGSDNGGGCRKGCSVSSTPQLVGWFALPLLAGAGLWRRRRARPRR